MFQISDIVWIRYNPSLDLSQCTVCSLVSSQAKRGRRKINKPGLGADYNQLPAGITPEQRMSGWDSIGDEESVHSCWMKQVLTMKEWWVEMT